MHQATLSCSRPFLGVPRPERGALVSLLHRGESEAQGHTVRYACLSQEVALEGRETGGHTVVLEGSGWQCCFGVALRCTKTQPSSWELRARPSSRGPEVW